MQSVIDEALTNIRRQEMIAAETLVRRVANRLRVNDLIVEIEVCEGRPTEMTLKRAGRPKTHLIMI